MESVRRRNFCVRCDFSSQDAWWRSRANDDAILHLRPSRTRPRQPTVARTPQRELRAADGAHKGGHTCTITSVQKDTRSRTCGISKCATASRRHSSPEGFAASPPRSTPSSKAHFPRCRTEARHTMSRATVSCPIKTSRPDLRKPPTVGSHLPALPLKSCRRSF